MLSSSQPAANTVKHRAAQHEPLEEAVFGWFTQNRAKGAFITDALVLEKAKHLAAMLGIAARHCFLW